MNFKGSKYLLFVIILLIAVYSCSSDKDDVEVEPLDLLTVEGKYIGSVTTEFGIGNISLVLSVAGNNRYDVDLYETLIFAPAFNLDGVTPEAVGFIEIDGEEAIIDVILDTDDPPCKGNYTGTGTRSDDGVFTFKMIIDHDCAQNAAGVITVTKTEN